VNNIKLSIHTLLFTYLEWLSIILYMDEASIFNVLSY